MATEQGHNSSHSAPGQDPWYTGSPSNVVLLLDLAEIRKLWGATHERVYRAVRDGKLRAYGRPGRQKYYSSVELIGLFGEPPTSPMPPVLKHPRNGRGATGG
jgi:hypothetical protein